MKTQFFKNIQYVPFAILGIAFVGVGISMYKCVALGVDPCSVFMWELSRLLGKSTYTQGSLITQGVLFLVLFIHGKHLLGMGTIVAWFMTGLFVDLFTPLFAMFITMDMHIAVRIGIYLLGTAFIGLGGGLYMSVGIGGAPIDMVPVLISEHVKLPFRYIRMIFDFSFLGLGILLGSTNAGLGSVITAFLIGPFFQFFIKRFKPMFEKAQAGV